MPAQREHSGGHGQRCHHQQCGGVAADQLVQGRRRGAVTHQARPTGPSSELVAIATANAVSTKASSRYESTARVAGRVVSCLAMVRLPADRSPLSVLRCGEDRAGVPVTAWRDLRPGPARRRSGSPRMPRPRPASATAGPQVAPVDSISHRARLVTDRQRRAQQRVVGLGAAHQLHPESAGEPVQLLLDLGRRPVAADHRLDLEECAEAVDLVEAEQHVVDPSRTPGLHDARGR